MGSVVFAHLTIHTNNKEQPDHENDRNQYGI